MASVILILLSSLSLGTACAFTATAAVVYGSENTTTLNEVLNEDQSSWLGNICFVHPIFLSFGFWYFGHFSCVIFFPFFPSCPLCVAKCRQRLRNIFITLSPKVTNNQKRNSE